MSRVKEINYSVEYPPYSESENTTLVLPASPEWCSSCNGSGGRSKFDVQGLDIDAMMEDDIDGSFREDYFGGKTDVPCDSCGGKGTHTVPDYENCTEEQKAILDDCGKQWQEHHREVREDEAVRRAESAF